MGRVSTMTVSHVSVVVVRQTLKRGSFVARGVNPTAFDGFLKRTIAKHRGPNQMFLRLNHVFNASGLVST